MACTPGGAASLPDPPLRELRYFPAIGSVVELDPLGLQPRALGREPAPHLDLAADGEVGRGAVAEVDVAGVADRDLAHDEGLGDRVERDDAAADLELLLVVAVFLLDLDPGGDQHPAGDRALDLDPGAEREAFAVVEAGAAG